MRYVGNHSVNRTDPSGLVPPYPIPGQPLPYSNTSPAPFTEDDYVELLKELASSWNKNGFIFASFLLTRFLDKDQHKAHLTAQDPLDVSRFSSVIQEDSDYQNALQHHIRTLAATYAAAAMPDLRPGDKKTIRVPDFIPAPGGNYDRAAFHVRHLRPGIGPDSNFFLWSNIESSPTDMAWAAGGAHYGYRNARLHVTATTAFCEYKVVFEADMILVDPYVFSDGIGRKLFESYRAGMALQDRFKYPTFHWRAEWKERFSTTAWPAVYAPAQ